LIEASIKKIFLTKTSKKHPKSLNKTAKSSTQRLHSLPNLNPAYSESLRISHRKNAVIGIPDDTHHTKTARRSTTHTHHGKTSIRRFKKTGNPEKINKNKKKIKKK